MTFDTQYPASLAESLDPHEPIKDAKRKRLWGKQRRERGFDDTELWNLDHTFARLMLPRLKVFMVQYEEMTQIDEHWKRDMAAIVAALELLNGGEVWCSGKAQETIAKGLKVFAKRLPGMWT